MDIWKRVSNVVRDAYDNLIVNDEKRFTNAEVLSDGRVAIGFYVDTDDTGCPYIDIIIDDGEDVDYDCIFSLNDEDAEKIVSLIETEDYD